MALFEAAALLIILIVDRLSTSNSQSLSVPPIICPNYFQYEKVGNENIGKITLPTSTFKGEINLKVRFSQRSPVLSNYYGKLSLYQDQATTINLLQNGEPIAYRVDFPLPNELPRLTHISANGHTVCWATEYPPPRTSLELDHALRVSQQTRVRTVPNTFWSSFDFPNNNVEFVHHHTPSSPTNRRPDFVPHIVVFENRTFSNNRPAYPMAPPNIRSDNPQNPPNPPNPQNPPNNQFSACGQEGGSGIVPFINGGTVLQRSQFPWLVAIYQKLSTGLQWLCGGSLISSRTVITAAHCFSLTQLTADRITVYLGRHDLNNYNEDNVVSRDVRTMERHPEFSESVLPDADLAVLTLELPVRFTQFIRPICLWNERADVNFILGAQGVVAGWGSDENGNGVSALPKMARATVVSEADCLRDSAVFQSLTTNRTLCAGDRDNTGPCMGDSGSGLMIKRNNQWFLRAVVSVGQRMQRRCYLQTYVVYCDVAKHMTWIRGAMMD